MSKRKFKDTNMNVSDVHPEKTDMYKSARVQVDHIETPTEIKASLPIQVRVNGGEWVDIRPLEEA